MVNLSSHFFINDQHPWQDLGGGVSRKIVGHTPELMCVVVRFAKGAAGTAHTHDVHTQISYVAAGSFEVNVGGCKQVLGPADGFIAPKHVLHGAVALEEGSMLVDMFSPRRDEFLE